jgi:PKD repeat protein
VTVVDLKTPLLKLRSSKPLAVTIAVVVLLAILVVTTGGSRTEEEETARAVADATPVMVRLGDPIAFTSEGSKGDNITWDFGDGTTSDEVDPVHTYDTSGWFNVTLTVANEKGKQETTTLDVGVQLPDVHNTRDLPRDRDVRPGWMHGFGLLGQVGPCTMPPTADLTYTITRAVGTFVVYVEFWVREGDVNTVERVHEEERTMTGQDLVFTYSVGPEDLPELATTNETYVHVSAMIDQGRWASGHITVDIEFPWGEEPIEGLDT